MKSLLKEIESKFKDLEEQDQDRDGDKDFADIMIARMMKSGMSREDAIKKVKEKQYNEQAAAGKVSTDDPAEAERLAKRGINVDLKDDVDEASTSAGAGSYNTPKSFSTPSQARRKKKMKYSGVAESMDKKYEQLIESYKKFALGDSKTTPDKKVKETIKEVSKKLQEIEQLVRYSSKLKTESGLSRDGYGPAVNNALTKISERLVKISERVRALGE